VVLADFLVVSGVGLVLAPRRRQARAQSQTAEGIGAERAMSERVHLLRSIELEREREREHYQRELARRDVEVAQLKAALMERDHKIAQLTNALTKFGVSLDWMHIK
jgi:hypothetical protein